jgi:hypothetical protein
MNTPITDAKIKAGFTEHERRGQEVPADLARRLELDRAALMEALDDLVSAGGNYCDLLNAADKSRKILSAARANFPTNH